MDIQAKSHFIDRTWHRLRQVWHKVSNNEHSSLSTQLQANLPDEDLPRLREQMQNCLKARGGEVSARAETAALGRSYLELNSEGRARFLKILAADFDVDFEQVEQAMASWQQLPEGSDRHDQVQQLRQALDAPRLQLLTQFNELPEGVKFLVDMRAELMQLTANDPTLKALEADLKRLLISWFDIGFLKLERITWDSPTSLLEKLIAYEAVHEIRSWDDLKNRLDSDRRCYAFLHPHMPGEPLIFIEVALTTELTNNVQNLLDETAPLQDLEQANTAIFYSISNAQQGLAGISFGNFLIKRVVAELSHEFPRLKQFSTLSPIVNYRRWLTQQSQENESTLLTQTEQKSLVLLCESLTIETGLQHLFEYPDWPQHSHIGDFLQPVLTRLAARYLSKEKRNNKRALDPVAHFHLTNGSRIEQLNWMGDQSEKGMRQSFGFMVNYLYQLDRIESNSNSYTEHGKINTSNAIKTLLKS